MSRSLALLVRIPIMLVLISACGPASKPMAPTAAAVWQAPQPALPAATRVREATSATTSRMVVTAVPQPAPAGDVIQCVSEDVDVDASSAINSLAVRGEFVFAATEAWLYRAVRHDQHWQYISCSAAMPDPGEVCSRHT